MSKQPVPVRKVGKPPRSAASVVVDQTKPATKTGKTSTPKKKDD